MSVTITNFDLFEEFFEYIKRPDISINDAIKEYGGSSFYIPSYKTTLRNNDIIKYYQEHYGEVGVVKYLAKEYDLTERQIYDITKEVRETSSLF